MLAVSDVTRLFLDAGGPAAVAALGWWLSAKFRKTEEAARVAAESVANKTQSIVEHHEAIDQSRHRENLSNFKELRHDIQTILIRLARAGINGDEARR